MNPNRIAYQTHQPVEEENIFIPELSFIKKVNVINGHNNSGFAVDSMAKTGI